MSITIEHITPQTVLELAQRLSADDQRWLVKTLDQLLDESLPESATVEEAIELYLAERCSLARAAELAGVTRWDLQDILHERGIPVSIHSDLTTDEMDDIAERLEQEGYL